MLSVEWWASIKVVWPNITRKFITARNAILQLCPCHKLGFWLLQALVQPLRFKVKAQLRRRTLSCGSCGINHHPRQETVLLFVDICSNVWTSTIQDPWQRSLPMVWFSFYPESQTNIVITVQFQRRKNILSALKTKICQSVSGVGGTGESREEGKREGKGGGRGGRCLWQCTVCTRGHRRESNTPWNSSSDSE